MRARSLKPQYFTNELLAVSDPIYGWVFQGLWSYSDREGRCEDRPAKIHMRVNSGRAFETTTRSLDWLTDHGFILRYSANRSRYIQVVNFGKHQNPHYKEPPSVIPAPAAELLDALKLAAGPGFDGQSSDESLGFLPDGRGKASDQPEAFRQESNFIEEKPGANGQPSEENPGFSFDDGGESSSLSSGDGAEQGEHSGVEMSPKLYHRGKAQGFSSKLSGKSRADSGLRTPDSSPPFPPSQSRGGNAPLHGAKPEARRPRNLRHESATAWDLVLQHLSDPPTIERENPTAHRAVILMGGYARIGMSNTKDTPKLKPVFREHYERVAESAEDAPS